MSVATLAFIVALLSFAIAAVALWWQVVKHFLDGGRVKVYLNTAILEPEFMVVTNRSGRFLLQNNQHARGVMVGRALELAQLVVENPGRIPVTIHSPGLAFSGHGTKNHSVVPRMFGTDGAFGLDEAITETVVRVEPYGRVTFLLDYWSVMPSILKDATNGRVFVRGLVGIAGKANRPGRSSWRRRWQISRGMYTSIDRAPAFTPLSVIWGSMYRQLPKHEDADSGRHPNAGKPVTREVAHYLLNQAMSRFTERPEREQLAGALDDAAKQYGDKFPAFGIALLDAYAALDRMEGHLTGWTEGLLTAQHQAKASTENAGEEAPG